MDKKIKETGKIVWLAYALGAVIVGVLTKQYKESLFIAGGLVLIYLLQLIPLDKKKDIKLEKPKGQWD